jgi:hypothetical protein
MLLLVRFKLAGSGDAFTDTRRRNTKHMTYLQIPGGGTPNI